MTKKFDANAPAAILVSWLAGLGAMLGAIVLTTTGQAIGALAGGCRWIGITLPIHQQPWALVNQPSLAFSSQTSSLGYWLGGPLLCLLVAGLAVNVLPRPRGLAWEIAAIQASWGAVIVGLCWVPLIDPWDGHFSRLLRLNDFSVAWVWAVPVLGAWVALIPTTRLLALVRSTRPHVSRAGRLATVILHLGAPALTWIAGGTVITGIFRGAAATSNDPSALFFSLWSPGFASALPLVGALLFAWVAYPRAWAGRLENLSPRAVSALCGATFTVAMLCLALGRPIPPNFATGILWAPENASHNIRSWVRPVRLDGGELFSKSRSR